MPQFDLRINGKTHQVDGAADDSLLSVLRYELNLTGSKFGCGEGQCGACTVLVDGLAVRSCVTRIGPVAGKAITTIEAVANGDALHPVQEAFVEADAFQCGYCTSGMVMATIGLLRTTPNPSDAEIARLMDRNVCRCGTYPRIVKAIKLAVDKNRQAGIDDVMAPNSPSYRHRSPPSPSAMNSSSRDATASISIVAGFSGSSLRWAAASWSSRPYPSPRSRRPGAGAGKLRRPMPSQGGFISGQMAE